MNTIRPIQPALMMLGLISMTFAQTVIGGTVRAKGTSVAGRRLNGR